MTFNSGTNSIVADVHYWAGTDSATYPIADLTRNANQALSVVSSKILRNDNSWEFQDFNATGLSIGLTDVVSGQADYTPAVTHLKILKVRIKDPQGNWITLTPVSRRQLTDSELNSTGVPSKYDKLGGSIFPYPKPNYDSEDGMEVQFQQEMEYFETTDTTKEPGFASPFHRLVSLYTALDFTEPNDLESRTQKIRGRIQAMELELERFYQDRDYDTPPNIGVAKEDYGQGSDYLM